MLAPVGTLMMVEMASPVTPQAKPMSIERNIIGLYREQNSSAIICGSERIEMSSMIPIRRMESTTSMAMKSVMQALMVVTCMPCVRAKSPSNAA